MTVGGPDRARELARTLLAACLPSAGPRTEDPATAASPAAALLTETFRCWTPLRDWERGRAGIETLRQILAAYCARLPDGVQFRLSALIAGDSDVVVEAATPAPGGTVSVTLVLTLDSDLVDEVRCYADPRAIDVTVGPPPGSDGDTGRR